MEQKTKTISLPRLNNLSPTLEGTALKLMEEAGELGAAISRYKDAEGPERELLRRVVCRELLDVAQTAITMMFVLEEEHGIDVQEVLSEHIAKLIRKGYIKIKGS
ncbi:MAG: MazG-like family protein [Bacillota bacterium]